MFLFILITAVACFFYFRRKPQAKVKPNSASSDPRNHAIVIGSGISGLITATVLSRHFRKITIIERDDIPVSADFWNRRRNPPQATQGHALLPLGGRILDRFLPGFTDELVKLGGAYFSTADLVFNLGKVWFDSANPKDPELLHFNSQTRPFLEYHLRQRILQNPNITQKKGMVLKFLYQEEKYDPDTHKPSKRKIINGVLWKPKPKREAAEKEETKAEPVEDLGSEEIDVVEDEKHGTEELTADFVACCLGRQFPLLKLLKELGCPEVPVDTLTINACYMTAMYRGTPEQEAAIVPKGIIQVPGPGTDCLSGYGCIPAENGLRAIFCFGYLKDGPPCDGSKDPKVFLPWLDTFPNNWTPHAKAIIDTWEQVTPFRRFLDPTISWRHFEKLSYEDWPDRLIVLGDAVCSLNPLFGQGMTHAARAAEALNDVFEAATHSPQLVSLDGLAHRFQAAHAKVSGVMWDGNKPDDMCRPSTKETAQTPKAIRVMNKFFSHILRTLQQQGKLNFFYMVTGGILPPTSLFHPSILVPALQSWAKEVWGKPSTKKEN